MRLLIASTLIAAASLANAAPANNDTTVQVQAPADKSYKVQPGEFAQQFKGSYILDDGRQLTLTSRGNHYYAQLSGQEAVQIWSVAPDAFVGERGMNLRFDAGEGKDVVLGAAR